VSETNQLEPKAIQFYINGIVVGDELNVNQTKTFEVVINYDKNAELHQGEFSKEISFTIDFEQKTQGSTVKPEMTVPNYSLDVISSSWSREKTVTITYPEGDNLIYQYSLDDGLTWKIVTTRIFTIKFEKEGSIIARVSDGRSSLTGEKQIIGNIDREVPNVTITGNTDTWSINKTLTIQASDTKSGLDENPYSYDGGTTWVKDTSKVFTTNQTVNIWVKDKAGNIKKQEIIINKIDESKPMNVSLTKGIVTSSSITVTASATQDITGIRGYQFSMDGGTYSEEQTSATKVYTGLDKNHEYTIKVKAIGMNGKEAESGVLKVSTNDIHIPTYSMTPSADTWATSKTVTITYPGEKESNHVYEYSKDGGTTWITVNTSSATVNFTTNGSVIARVRDTGNSNNTVTASTLSVSKIDTTAPTVSVSGNTDTWSINKTLTIQASDTESGLHTSPYSFDGGATWSATTSKTFTTNQTVNIWVKDALGNIAKQAITISKIDTVAPSNVMLTKGSVTSSSITVSASATQANMGIRGYQFSIDGGAYSTEQTSATKIFTGLNKNTSHTIQVKAIGKNGKSAESTVLTVSTNNIQTPTYSVTPSVDTWATSKTVTITYPGTKTDNLVYEYSKDGGTTWINVTASSTSVTFTSNGSVIARVRDTGNNNNTVTGSTYSVTHIGCYNVSDTGVIQDYYCYTGNPDGAPVNASVTIPTTVEGIAITSIGDAAFSGKSLTNVTIPSTIKTIGNYAFEDNQLTSITIPNTVTSVGTHAFENNKITTYSWPTGIHKFPDYVFATNQIASLSAPSHVTEIGVSSFASNQMTTLQIPTTITKIGNGAFKTNQLTSVVIPTSITRIEDNTFMNNKLTSIEIPISVTYVGASSFANNQLTSMTLQKTTPPTFANQFINGNTNTKIYVPTASYSTYVTAVNGKLPSGASVVKGYFEYDHVPDIQSALRSGTKTVTPESQFTIDSSGTITAYSGTSKDVIIPQTINGISVKGIAPSEYNLNYRMYEGVFVTLYINAAGDNMSSDGITSLVFPQGLESVGDSALKGANGSGTFVFPSSLKTLGYESFADAGWTGYEFKGTVPTIGEAPFASNFSHPGAAITTRAADGTFSYAPRLQANSIKVPKGQLSAYKALGKKAWFGSDYYSFQTSATSYAADITAFYE
ncbi:MAG: leucine-rich repeat protein, partial [Firmicutes bacterium]|nr:leucine-rich repeat protein [Bacillota bacterium]